MPPTGQPVFDYTIHLGDLVAWVVLAIGLVKVFLAQRDTVRDVVHMMGTKNPREGLAGDVEHLKEAAAEHRDWLVAAGLDRRHGIERRSGVQ
jgi:hypothetical protein